MWNPSMDKLWSEYEGRCPICGFDPFTSERIYNACTMQVFHLVPGSKGVPGVDSFLNTILSCMACNQKAGYKVPFDPSEYGTEQVASDLVEKRMYVTLHKLAMSEKRDHYEKEFEKIKAFFRKR